MSSFGYQPTKIITVSYSKNCTSILAEFTESEISLDNESINNIRANYYNFPLHQHKCGDTLSYMNL